jgi:hypothetical protein
LQGREARECARILRTQVNDSRSTESHYLAEETQRWQRRRRAARSEDGEAEQCQEGGEKERRQARRGDPQEGRDEAVDVRHEGCGDPEEGRGEAVELRPEGFSDAEGGRR